MNIRSHHPEMKLIRDQIKALYKNKNTVWLTFWYTSEHYQQAFNHGIILPVARLCQPKIRFKFLSETETSYFSRMRRIVHLNEKSFFISYYFILISLNPTVFIIFINFRFFNTPVGWLPTCIKWFLIQNFWEQK